MRPTNQVVLCSNYKQNILFIATKRNTHAQNRLKQTLQLGNLSLTKNVH